MEYGAVMVRTSKVDDPESRAAVTILRDAFASSTMNRADLSTASGVPEGTLSGIFAGTKPLYVAQFLRLVAALELDIAEVADQVEKRVSETNARSPRHMNRIRDRHAQ